jgi:hypothetical protein
MSESKRPDPPVKPGPAGRVKHDASGRAVWEWAVDTGRHALDSTSRLLKRLELPGLSLEDEAGKKQRDEKEAGADKSTFGGPPEADPNAGRQSFNPYDNRAPNRRSTSTSRTSAIPGEKNRPQPAAPASRKRGFLARLLGRR